MSDTSRPRILGRYRHRERGPLCHMSESAANVKLFFPSHSCLESIQADTLLPDGAEDKALLGSNLSADSGAKTRLGFRASWTPAVRFEKHNWDWHQQRQNPRGMGTESPYLQ